MIWPALSCLTASILDPRMTSAWPWPQRWSGQPWVAWLLQDFTPGWPHLDLVLKSDLVSPELPDCFNTWPQDDLSLTLTSEMIWPSLSCLTASRLHLRMTSPLPWPQRWYGLPWGIWPLLGYRLTSVRLALDDLTLTSTSEMIWPALSCLAATRLFPSLW